MSHYAVAVFSDSPDRFEFDRLLAPFDETDEKYYVFKPVTDEELVSGWEKFHEQNPNWYYSQWLEQMYHLQGNQYGYYYNPNAKYDYYSLDGKAYMYELTPEAERELAAHKDDPDFEYPVFYKKSQLHWFGGNDEDDRDEARWRKCWAKLRKNDGDGFFSFRYYEERYGTVSQYVKEMMRPATPYAFVTPDGVWHAPGNVGWFAMSDETADTQDKYWDEWCDFIKNAPDCYVSICDFHI
jgi:hypothetical protein